MAIVVPWSRFASVPLTPSAGPQQACALGLPDDPSSASERRVGPVDRRRNNASGPSGQLPPMAGEASESGMEAWKVAEVAQLLQASESWVRQAAASGRLPCTEIGDLLRFEPEEVRFLASAQAPTRALLRQ